ARAEAAGQPPPTAVYVGAMLEAPSLAYELDALKGVADFVSVGTNDLMQFFHAADRASPHIADRYDLVSRSALTFLKQIASACARCDIPVSVCGEAAGRPVDALALLACGFERLSMPAGGVAPVKEMVRSLDLSAFQPVFDGALEKAYGSFRNELLAIARQHGVVFGDA
ncbi:MAG: putative PEP-binding protein, partial [Pseudomonadota bacterium]